MSAVDFQALCEIAERELNAGLADPQLVARSLAEANGVPAHARQIYWRRRATQLHALQQSDGADAITAVLAAIADQEGRLRRRKHSYRWFWAVTCVVAMLGAVSFPFCAIAAGHGARLAFYLILSVGSLALAMVSYLASRYHTHTE